MKRLFKVTLVLTLTLVLLLVLAFAAAQAQEEVPILILFDGQTYEVGPGQVGVIQWGWVAANRGLVHAFWVQVDQEFVLTKAGDPGWSLTITSEEARQHLTPIERAPAFDEVCFGNKAMGSRLAYYLWDLEPGFYTLQSRGFLAHPLTDACDGVYPDGKPDRFEGELLDTEVYINVLGQ